MAITAMQKPDTVLSNIAMATPSAVAVFTSLDHISVQDWLAVAGILFIAAATL